MGDHQTERILAPALPLATVVTASTACPPFRSPVVLTIDPARLVDREEAGAPPAAVRLTDGGINGYRVLENVWQRCRTLLFSDGGGCVAQPSPSQFCPLSAYRVLVIIRDRAHALRLRLLIFGFHTPAETTFHRSSAYVGIAAAAGSSDPPGAVRLTAAVVVEMAPTSLARLVDLTQDALIKLGYSVCAASVRRFYRPDRPPPASLPFTLPS